MFGLTYDLWKEIIDEIAIAHDSLFAAMHQAADDLQLSTALIDDLKSKRELKIANDPWEFLLMIDFIEDKINGFIIYLATARAAGNLGRDQGECCIRPWLFPGRD